jgi:hypothetical protein
MKHQQQRRVGAIHRPVGENRQTGTGDIDGLSAIARRDRLRRDRRRPENT